MKKIENIIGSCAVCRHCGTYARCDGERRATICEKAARIIALAVDDEAMDATMPAWCPLETYGQEGLSAGPSPVFNPPTVTLCGLKWMAVPLSGYGGTEILNRTYYTQAEALEAAKQVGNGWRLPTKEEFVALADLGSTWVEEGPWGLPGRWFGGNHDTDHEGSLFFEASGFRIVGFGGLYGVGTYGYSWSSSPTSTSSVNGSYLSFRSGNVNPEGGNGRADDFPVRLVREAR